MKNYLLKEYGSWSVLIVAYLAGLIAGGKITPAVLFHNLEARLDGGSLMPFEPGGEYLLIFNLGGGVGVLKKRWLELGGRPAFIIKDYIDRKFMKEFQAIEQTRQVV